MIQQLINTSNSNEKKEEEENQIMMPMQLESQQEDIQLTPYPINAAVIHLYRLFADINHTVGIKLSCCIPILQCGVEQAL